MVSLNIAHDLLWSTHRAKICDSMDCKICLFGASCQSDIQKHVVDSSCGCATKYKVITFYHCRQFDKCMQTLKNDNVLLREIQHPVSATYYNFIVLMQGLAVSFFSISFTVSSI